MSLRDILEQQRKAKEQANGQVSGSKVVQSETKPEMSKPVAQEPAKKPSVLDKFKPKSITVVANEPATTGNIQNETPKPQPTPVVEQSRPLTLLERRKLEAQNAKANNSAIASTVNVEPVQQKAQVQSPQQSEVSQPSASQAADNQKTNDGVANIEELKRNLAYLANNIENKDLVKDIVKTIAVQIKNNPELFPHMTRGDNNLMVRGLRMAYQVAAMKKQEKNEKKKRDDKGVSELAAMAKEIGLDFSGLKLG